MDEFLNLVLCLSGKTIAQIAGFVENQTLENLVWEHKVGKICAYQVDAKEDFIMNPAIETAAASYIAPKVFRGFRFRWLVYGAAAYYGLKFLNKRGILPKQTDAALNLIDRGINVAKQRVGITPHAKQTTHLTH